MATDRKRSNPRLITLKNMRKQIKDAMEKAERMSTIELAKAMKKLIAATSLQEVREVLDLLL